MNELHLFAGAGGGILGGILCGHTTVCAVELDAACRRVLLARQRDGCLPRFPVWDDVRTFDGRPWRGLVDIVCGGFPCQDISVAGKGAGLAGERSGLWREMARIVGEVRPRFVLVENSPMLVRRGLATVLADLAALGYDARWGVVGADDAGAPHRRKRLWLLAHAPRREGEPREPTGVAGAGAGGQSLHAAAGPGRGDVAHAEGRGCAAAWLRAEAGVEAFDQRELPARPGAALPDPHGAGREEQRSPQPGAAQHPAAEHGGWWRTEPDVGRVAHGVAARVDRLRSLGNGQVPAVVRLALQTLMNP